MSAAGGPATRSPSRGRVDVYLAYCSSILLALLVLFIVLGVVLRFAFNAPIPGANEVVELASVALVMLGVPYCTTTDSHVRIDLLDPVLGERGRALTDLLYRVLGVIVLGFVVRAYVGRALEAFEYRDVTNMLRVPIWPLHALIAFGMAAYALILVWQQVRRFGKAGSSHG